MRDGPSVRSPVTARRPSTARRLTLEQEELAKAVLAANPKTIVVLQASFPYTTNVD